MTSASQKLSQPSEGEVDRQQPWVDALKYVFIPPPIMQKPIASRAPMKGADRRPNVTGQNQSRKVMPNLSETSKAHGCTNGRNKRSLRETIVKMICQNTEEEDGLLPYEMRFKDFIEKGLDLMNVTPLESSWLKRILGMIPRQLKILNTPLESLIDEVKEDYLLYSRTAAAEHTFRHSKISEENVNDVPLHRLELAVVPKPWKDTFIVSRRRMRDKLHSFNPVMQQVLCLWQDCYKNLRLVNVEDFHSRAESIELSEFQEIVSKHADQATEILLNNWLLDVQDIYYQASRRILVPLSCHLPKLHSFFNSLAVLMTSQLQNLALDSLWDYTHLISPDPRSQQAYEHPGFVLNLYLEDKEIKIEPELRLYEDAFLNVFELILSSVSAVPRVETLLYPDWTGSNFRGTLNPIILSEVVQAQQEEVCKAFLTECVRPKEYVRQYDKYAALVSGQAEKDVQEFLTMQYSFEDILAQIRHYQKLADQIQYTSNEVVRLGLFEVQSHRLIDSLIEHARDLQQTLATRVLLDHQEINKNLCNEFEKISEKALIVPSNMQELAELKGFMNEVEIKELPLLEQKLAESNTQLCFLMDFVSLSPSDMELNTQTNQWLMCMSSIFKKHKQIMTTTAEQYQSGLKVCV